jgi:hypothetical protein
MAARARRAGTRRLGCRAANGFANETLRDGETARDVGGNHRPDSLVSGTCWDAGDGGDVRRSAHNPTTRLATLGVDQPNRQSATPEKRKIE